MPSQALLFGLSFLALFYWFRYHCAAVLRKETSTEITRHVADANHLSFADARAQLEKASGEQLRKIGESLRRDYRVLTCLLRYTSGTRPARYTVEQRLLMLDFRLMHFWHSITHRHLYAQSRWALAECSLILTYFANAMGERSAVPSRA